MLHGNSPAFADLRSVFFDFNDFPLSPGNITVTHLNDGPVTAFEFVENGSGSNGGAIANNANITPIENWDGGVEIGTQGIGGGDDWYFTSCLVSSSSETLTLGTHSHTVSIAENKNHQFR